jgi:endonuclease/exonuclease/phosphatase family metal-dependent hydrolase
MYRRISIPLLFVLGFHVASVAFAATNTFIDRPTDANLRIATLNTFNDSIFSDVAGNRADKFARVAAVIAPDIWCFQEIYDHTATQVKTLMDTIQPLGNANGWYVYKPDEHTIVSKFPLTLQRTNTSPVGYRGVAMAQVQLPDDKFARDLYLMNAHYKCCGGFDPERQKQSDAFVNWMRDARTTGGTINLAANTPMMVLGDINLVDGQQPLTTLLNGDIQTNATFGADSLPDWDGSNNSQVFAVHNAVGPDNYTWRDDASGFAPGRLDYMTYTDTVMSLKKSFVLNTVTMAPADLTAAGLQQYDSVYANSTLWDHMPVVADFALLPALLKGDFNLDGVVTSADIKAMLAALTDLPSYQSSQMLTAAELLKVGDLNSDGKITNTDIQSLLSLLAGSGSIAAVPEPATAALALIGTIVIAVTRVAHKGSTKRRRDFLTANTR